MKRIGTRVCCRCRETTETGILMYELPDATAGKIGSEGVSFFSRLGNVERRVGYQRAYSEWHETPIVDGVMVGQ